MYDVADFLARTMESNKNYNSSIVNKKVNINCKEEELSSFVDVNLADIIINNKMVGHIIGDAGINGEESYYVKFNENVVQVPKKICSFE
jgi:hypothetical protein